MANKGEKTAQKGRIRYIEPSNVVSAGKERRDNEVWAMEEYNISVDLQVITPLRVNTVALSGNDDKLSITAMNNSNPIGRYVSFLQGSKLNEGDNGSLTDKYINSTYTEIKNGKVSSAENLGITRVDVRFDEQFYPQVQITFVDVRGFSLMMPSEKAMYQDEDFNSLFNALFHYPYPRFLLTLKGQYGTKITLQLAVSEFYTSFNQNTGNFEVTVDFIGYMYGLYCDIPMNLLIAAPYYNCDDVNSKYKYWKEQVDAGVFLYDNGQPIMTFVEFLAEVYNVNRKMANGELSEIATDLSVLEEKLTLINDVESAHQAIVDSAYEREDLVKSFVGDFYSVFIIKKGKDKDSIEKLTGSMITKVADLNNKIAAFNNKGNGVKIEGISTTAEDYKLRYGPNSSVFFETSGLSALTINGINTLEKCLLEIDDNVLKKKIEDAKNKEGFFKNFDAATTPYFIYNFKPASDIIRNARTQCEEDISKYQAENEGKLQKGMEDALTEALGFSPTVENIYRMIFAHLDCFMHEFYAECLDVIMTDDGEKSKRPLSLLARFHDDLMTNSGYDYIPPFPNIFRQEYDERNNKFNELLWPGEEDEFKNLEEVKFINNLLDGVIAVKRASNEIFKREKIEDGAGNYNYDWYPTNILDYAHKTNPYIEMIDDIRGTGINSEGMPGFLYNFAKKRIQAAWATCNSDANSNGTAIAQLEAYSFYKANPTVPPYLKQFLMEDKGVANLKEIGKKYEESHEKVIFKEISPYFTSLDPTKTDRRYFGEGISGVSINDFVNVLYNAEQVNEFIKAWNTPPEFADTDTVSEFSGRPLVSAEKPLGENSFLYEQPNGANYNVAEDYTGLTRVYSLSDFNAGNKYYYLKEPQAYNEIVEEASKNTDGNSPTPTYRVPYLNYKGDNGWTVVDKGAFEETALKIVAAIGAGKNNSLDQCIINNKSFLSLNSIESILWTCGYKKFGDAGKYTSLIKKNFDKAFINVGKKLDVNIYNALGGLWDSYMKDEAPKGALGKIIELLNREHFQSTTDRRYNARLSQAIIEFITSKAFFVRSRLVNEINGDKVDDVMGTFWTTLQKIYGFSKTSGQNRDEEIGYKDITNSHRLALYETLKRLYDKWLSGYDKGEFVLRDYKTSRSIMESRYSADESSYNGSGSEFDNFIYIDSFYRDISKRYFINPRVIYNQLQSHIEGGDNFSVYEFMYTVAQENKLLFIALPVYNNIYSPSHLEDIFKPHFYYNQADSTVLGMGTTYVVMYPHEVSHFANDEAMVHYTGYRDDGFDLADTNGDILPTAVELFKTDDNGLAYAVPAFGVTYAKQNQSYFKRIRIDMNNPRVTDFSIANTFELGRMDEFGGAVNVQMVGQDLYSVFSNRSYKCSVEMLGCMNIMPMMYFQLNNIPMIKGAYIVTNVHHTFVPGNATTIFDGVRVSKNTIPYNKDIFNFRVFKELVNNSGNLPRITYDNSGEGNSGYGNSPIPIPTGSKPFVGLDRDKKMQICIGMDTKTLKNERAKNSKMNGETFREFICKGEYKGINFELNKAVVEDFKAIVDEILALGWFKIITVATHRVRNSVPSSISRHCMGMAVDINAGDNGNPYCNTHIKESQAPFKKGDKIPWSFVKDRKGKPISAYYGGYDETRCIWTWDHPVVKIFLAHGWGWGGRYGDTMHFSVDNGN